MRNDKQIKPPIDADTVSTRIVSHSFELDGIPFSWWAVDQSPSLVTVSSQYFGRKAEFHPEGDEATARKMATAILDEHFEKAERIRARLRQRMERRRVL